MEQKIVTIIAQESMIKMGEKVQNEIDRLKPGGWVLRHTDTVYNGSSYSSMLIFNNE